MSRRRNYAPETIAAMERCFKALDACIDAGLLRSLTAFCEQSGIDRRHLAAQRKDLGRGYFELAWMLPLVEKCGISPMWLLSGRGPMFSQ